MLMHGFLQPHDCWGDIPRGLGTIVVTFKPSSETCQTGGECINHPLHVPHFEIVFLTFWLPSNPISFAMFWSSWPLSTWILQCFKLMTIWSSVTLNSTVMAKVLVSQTSLWFWEWFSFTLRFDHWLVRGLSHKPLVSHIPLLLYLHILNNSGDYHQYLGFHKLHFLGCICSQTALSSLSQSASVGEWFLASNYIIKLLVGNSLYFSIRLNHLKLKEFDIWISFG